MFEDIKLKDRKIMWEYDLNKSFKEDRTVVKYEIIKNIITWKDYTE